MTEGTSLLNLQKEKIIIQEYYELVYANILDNIDEMDKFLKETQTTKIDSRIHNLNTTKRRDLISNQKLPNNEESRLRCLHC